MSLHLSSSVGSEIIPEDDPLDSLLATTEASISYADTSVSLEGFDWFLTTLILTVDALLIQLHLTGEKWSTLMTWLVDIDCDSGWSCLTEKTFFLLAVTLINGCLLVPTLNMNIRTPSLSTWRFCMASAWASLILLNILTAAEAADSVTRYLDHSDEYWVSRFLLVGLIVLITFILDVYFTSVYGFLSCLTWNEQGTIEIWNGLRPIIGLEKRIDVRTWRERLNLRKMVQRAMYTSGRHNWHQRDNSTFKFIGDFQQGVQRFIERRRLQNVKHKLETRITKNLQDMPTEDVQYLLGEAMAANSSLYFATFKQKLFCWWDSVAEEPGFFEYTAWMRAAISVTLLMLLFNGIKAIEVFFALDRTWQTGHTAVLNLHQGLETVRDTTTELRQAWRKISDATMIDEATQNLIAELQTQVAALDYSVEQFLPDGITDSMAYKRASSMLNIAIIRASRFIRNNNFDSEKIISAIYYADSLLRSVKYAALIGYPVGTLVGLVSLYMVMRQHKDMSMGLAREHLVRSPIILNHGEIEKLEVEDSLLGLQHKYPISQSVYFIGILSSTAVVQQHIFGMVTTLFLATLFNIADIDVLMEFGGWTLCVYSVIIIVNFINTHILGDLLLTQNGYKIKHPMLFFIYLCIFTAIHGVLGFFYAVWRMLLLLMTSVWTLNRLDMGLFLTLKKLDHGHSSFMSMLVLTHIIRATKDIRDHGFAPSTVGSYSTHRTVDLQTQTSRSSGIQSMNSGLSFQSGN